MTPTTFPDAAYLENLLASLKKKAQVRTDRGPIDEFITYSGIQLDWIADFLTDENITWTRRELPVADLWLTGTFPEWNRIVIDQAERSPEKLKALMSDAAVAKLFADIPAGGEPILLRVDEEKFKVLDGMDRALAAIRDGRETIDAYVGENTGTARPHCESHVIYDLIRPYLRGITNDRAGLISALRFLRSCYANVEPLLRTRFSREYILNDAMSDIIEESLKN